MALENIESALSHLRTILVAMRPRGALLNGNIEMFLKTLFASHFDQIDNWSYVMDKCFKRQQIDLLLMKAGSPHAAIEFKCTLFADAKGSAASATKAMTQAGNNANLRLVPDFSGCESYVVHFLCAHYRETDLPSFVYPRFARLRSPITGAALLDIYEQDSKCECAKTIRLIYDEALLPGVQIEALVVKLTRPPVDRHQR
jgi:hypothetical protein